MSSKNAVLSVFVEELYEGEGSPKPLMRSPEREEVTMIRDLLLSNALRIENVELAMEATDLREDWLSYCKYVLPTLRSEQGQGSLLVSLGLVLFAMMTALGLSLFTKAVVWGALLSPILEVSAR